MYPNYLTQWYADLKKRLTGSLLSLGITTVILFNPISSDIVQAQGHGHGHGDANASNSMEAIVVTAERIDDYVENYPNQVVVLNKNDISKRNMLSVTDALQSMPGVDVKKSSGLGSRISIRGSGKSGGVLVLLNGRPLNSSQYGAVDLASLPIETVQSITVFKPPVPVWLGAGASQGAINIVTRTTGDKKKEKGHSTQIRAAGGSYGLVEGSLSHRSDLDQGAFMATASGNHKDGKRTNSDKNSGNASLNWSQKFSGEREVELDGRYYISEYGSPGPFDNPTPDARQRYENISVDGRFGGLVGTAGDYGFNLYGDMVALTDESQSGLTSDLDSIKLGAKGENNWFDPNNNWEVRLNGILEREDVDHTISGAHHRVTAGLGAQVDRRFKALTATLGLRGDHTTDFDINPGLSSGLALSLARNWLVKANAGYSVSLPTFGQLYQPSHGSIDQVEGNPELDKEKIWSFDAGMEYRPDKIRLFQLTFFRSDTKDPIVYQRRDDLVYQPFNGDNAFRQGLEGTIKYGFEMGVVMDYNLIIQDSQLKDTGKKLPYTPRYKFSATLQYTLPKINTRLESTLRYSSEQYSEMENRESQKLDEYVTVDLKAVQPFKIKQINAEWFLNVDNLFDKDFQIHYGYPADGICFISGLNLTF